MRLIIARCEITYSGRLATALPMAVRLLVLKSDGSVMVHADSGGYKPQNWMTAPTVVEIEGAPPERIAVRKGDERIDVAIEEVLLDVEHDMGEAAALEKDGVERDLQELLAGAPHWCGEGYPAAHAAEQSRIVRTALDLAVPLSPFPAKTPGER